MPKKDHPQVERYPQKDRYGWLWSEQQQLVCRFRNALPSAHAKWIEVETRSLHAAGQPVVRRLLRHNAIDAWTHMLQTGWVRSAPRW